MTHAQDPSHDPESKLSLGRLLFRVLLAVVIVGLLVGYSMCFQVSEGYKAVVTRFDKPIKTIHEAGLYRKWPWPIEQARLIDVRRRIHNTPYTATFTKDRRSVVLLTYVVWYVEDPLLFLQSVGNAEQGQEKLNGIVLHRKNFYLGRYNLSDLVSTDPDQIKTPEIEASILADVAKDGRERFGIRVEQVGVKRIAYDEENIRAVLGQMRAERVAEAKRYRAEGTKVAAQIRADAKVLREEKLRDAREEAGEILGRAAKERARIIREATSLDNDFYEFWRRLQAFKVILGKESMLIFNTEHPFFQMLRAMPEPPQGGPASETIRVPGSLPESASAPANVSEVR